MAREEYSSAYDLSLFETSEAVHDTDKSSSREKSNVIRLPERNKEKLQRRRHNPFVIFGMAFLVVAATAVLATIVQSNVRLNELNQKMLETENEIVEQQKRAAQYQVIVDSKLSIDTIQQYAEDELGMTKAQKSQKKFISLAEGDVGEVVTEDGSNNILDMMSQAFKGLWS